MARRGALRTLAFFESFFLIFFFGAVFFFVAGFAAFFSATSGTSSSASAKGSSVRERRVFQAAAGAGGAVSAPRQGGDATGRRAGPKGPEGWLSNTPLLLSLLLSNIPITSLAPCRAQPSILFAFSLAPGMARGLNINSNSNGSEQAWYR